MQVIPNFLIGRVSKCNNEFRTISRGNVAQTSRRFRARCAATARLSLRDFVFAFCFVVGNNFELLA